MWPHFLTDASWSSKWTPAAPASIIAFISSKALSTPPNPLFPCSEFIGLDRFRGGNLFRDRVEDVLQSEPFGLVTGRKVEDIEPCRRCAIRHFCGSPCPAEAHEMRGA